MVQKFSAKNSYLICAGQAAIAAQFVVMTNTANLSQGRYISAVKGFKKEELTSWAKAHLTPKSIVVSDGLTCFRAVKDAEILHLGVVTSGGLSSVDWPYFKWANTMISNVKNSMHGTYHAINQKHLHGI